MRKAILLVSAAAIAAAALASCSGEPGSGTSDLYLLEELETARAIEDPAERVERLELYASEHASHPYRALAYDGILETMAVEKGDVEGALARFDTFMERETDPAVRGKLLFSKFQFFWETDSTQSVAVAREVIGSDETDFRLLMYMAYYLMGAEGQEETADAVFRRLIEVTDDEHRKNHARTIYAEFLEEQGREEEAAEMYGLASGYTFANAPIGRKLWDEGSREEALERYIRLSAGAPGYRGYIKLDSLYSVVYPDAKDLDSRIAASRVSDGPVAPDSEFVDIRGMRHSMAGYRGTKVVVTAFSPT